MTERFQDRLPTLSDDQLRAYLARPGDYRPEAVAAAAAELRRRGQGPTEAEWQALQAALEPPPRKGPDPRRMRTLAWWTLGVGLGAALLIRVTTPVPPPDPLGYDPLDTKRYLRELEMVGGKANVLATQFRQWAEALWAGPDRAYVVAAFAGLLAAVFRFLGREPRA